MFSLLFKPLAHEHKTVKGKVGLKLAKEFKTESESVKSRCGVG